MNKENGISQELISMDSFLAGYSRKMPYSAPAGYFSNFGAELTGTIEILDKPELMPLWGRALPYFVPGGYFEALTDHIVSMAVTSDAISNMPVGSSYNVPAGYFETLPGQMLLAAKASDVEVKTHAKLIPLRRRKGRSTIRWAAAAVMLMCIGLGSFEAFYSGAQPSHEKMLSSVTSGDIHDYLQHTYRLDVDQIVSADINNLQVDSKDIIQYLNETGWDQTE